MTVGRSRRCVSVYADGRVISPGWTVTGYEERRQFVVRRLTPSGVATLVAALDAGDAAGRHRLARDPTGCAAGYRTLPLMTVRRRDELVTAGATERVDARSATRDAVAARRALARGPVATYHRGRIGEQVRRGRACRPRRSYLSILIQASGATVPGAPERVESSGR